MAITYLEEIYDQVRLTRFFVGETEYAVEINHIQEILIPPPMRELPNMPNFVEGFFTLRGKIVPVLDLRKLFGTPVEKSPINRVIVHVHKNVTLGFLVDRIDQVLNVRKSELLPAPPIVVRGIPAGCLSKVVFHGDQNILLLDLTKIMPEEAKLKLNQAATKAL